MSAEQNGRRNVLFSEKIVFTGADGSELFSADLVKLAMDLQRLRQQHGEKYAEYIEAVRGLAVDYGAELLTTCQAWCLAECVTRAWDDFKKKFDAELMLLTTMESTPSDLMSERSTTMPPSCPDS